MASSVSSVALVPINVAQRPPALRPVDAGAPTAFDLDAIRRAQAAQAEAPREPRAGEAQGDDTGSDRRSGSGRQAPAGDSAPFLAQLLSQERPASSTPPSPGDVSRAYGRFREEPQSGFVLDQPARIDVRV